MTELHPDRVSGPQVSLSPTEPLVRVLVVDDRPDVRLSFCYMLEASGYAVAEAGDGAEALAVLARQRIDVILTDLHMPGVDGPAFIRLVRRAYLPPPVIIAMTGSSAPAVTASHNTAAQLGADMMLQKPITREQLIRVIREELNRRAGPRKGRS